MSRMRSLPANALRFMATPFSPRNYGGRPNYVRPTKRGWDNKQPLSDMFEDMAEKGGGVAMLDAGMYWCSEPPNIITGHGITIQGTGDRSTAIVHEPEAHMTRGLLHFSAAAPTTTQGQCAVEKLRIMGFPAGATAQYKKIAIASECGSEMLLHRVTTADWNTDAAHYGSGPTAKGSIGWLSQGKELATATKCTFFTDRPICLDRNTKEPSVQIDTDTFHLQDLYLGMPVDGPETAIEVMSGSVFRQFVWDGANSVVGGNGGFLFDDTAGVPTNDGTVIAISGVRTEQQKGNGWTCKIRRPGPSRQVNVALANINCNFETNGIYLEGCQGSSILNCQFDRNDRWSTAPTALALKGYTFNVLVAGFMIPTPGGWTPIYDVADMARVIDLTGDAGIYSQLPGMVYYSAM